MKNHTKLIGIFTAKISGVSSWDPDSIHSGIAGSEEAVIYIAKELARLGYRVIIFGNPPHHSIHSSPQANPRFVDACDCDYPQLDIAISWFLTGSLFDDCVLAAPRANRKFKAKMVVLEALRKRGLAH